MASQLCRAELVLPSARRSARPAVQAGLGSLTPLVRRTRRRARAFRLRLLHRGHHVRGGRCVALARSQQKLQQNRSLELLHGFRDLLPGTLGRVPLGNDPARVGNSHPERDVAHLALPHDFSWFHASHLSPTPGRLPTTPAAQRLSPNCVRGRPHHEDHRERARLHVLAASIKDRDGIAASAPLPSKRSSAAESMAGAAQTRAGPATEPRSAQGVSACSSTASRRASSA
jgi:hypothetical protein